MTNVHETRAPFGLLHKHILELGLCLGFKLPSTGICYGFTMRWIEAYLSNTLDIFTRRTQLMIELSLKPYWLKCELRRLKTEPPFNSLFWEIIAFFESCALYQSPHHYPDIFLMRLLQRQIEHISTIASSVEVFQMGGLIQSKGIYYAEFNFSNLKSFAQRFESIVEQHQYQKPLTMLMTCIETSGFHCLGLTYTSSTKRWSFIDINGNPLSTNTTSIDEICRQISYMRSYCFNIKLILTANFHHTNLLEQLINLQTYIVIPESRRRCHAFLNLAVYEKEDKLVTTLLKQENLNINLNSKHSISPLMIAVQNNYLSILNIILSDKRTDPNYLNQEGIFPLYLTARQGHLQCLKRLLAHHQINPNLSIENGDTSLHIAILHRHLNIVKELLCHPDIDPNQANQMQMSPLHLAAFQGNIHIVKALLSHENINPNCAMKDGTTPLILSIFQGNLDVFYALISIDGIQIDKPFFSNKSQLISFVSQFNAEIRLRTNLFIQIQSDFSPIVITPLTLAKIMGNTHMILALDISAGKETEKSLPFPSSLSL